jgi:hypothetical protein
MTHNSEDELLRYALEVIANEEERASMAAHLTVCSECRVRLEDLRKDIQIVGGVRPRRRVLLIPNSRPREVVAYTILRTAALIILGSLVGFGASKGVHRELEFVSSGYVTLSPPTDSLTPYAVSDATDVPAHYYVRLLEQGK